MKSWSSTFKYQNDNEGFWSSDARPRGEVSWAHEISEHVFFKDKWVHIWAGNTSWQRTAANDMRVSSDIRMLKSVWVELIS